MTRRHVAAAVAIATVAPWGGVTHARAVQQDHDPPTPAERTGYFAFTPADSVGPWLAELAAGSPAVEAALLDMDDGSESRLPVVRIEPTVDTPGLPTVRVLVVGAQHGDERVGLEVGLRLARDLASGPLVTLRRWLDIRIVPAANPSGVRGRHRLSAGVDLATDHLRLEAPETRAVWREVADWAPHLLIDIHEIGPSEYGVQVAAATHPGVDPSLVEFARFRLLPHAARALAGVDVRYRDFVQTWGGEQPLEIAASPLAVDEDGPDVWFSPPSPSPHVARNAFALAGAMTFEILASSSRDVLGLAERTEATYSAVAAILRAAAEQALDLTSVVEAARRPPTDPVPARPAYVASDPPRSFPWVYVNEKGQAENGVLSPWRDVLEARTSIEVTPDWWVDAGDVDLLRRVERHGFEVAAPRRVEDGARSAALFCPDVPPPSGELSLRRVPSDQPGARLLHVLLDEAGAACGPFRLWRSIE